MMCMCLSHVVQQHDECVMSNTLGGASFSIPDTNENNNAWRVQALKKTNLKTIYFILLVYETRRTLV